MFGEWKTSLTWEGKKVKAWFHFMISPLRINGIIKSPSPSVTLTSFCVNSTTPYGLSFSFIVMFTVFCNNKGGVLICIPLTYLSKSTSKPCNCIELMVSWKLSVNSGMSSSITWSCIDFTRSPLSNVISKI